MTLDEDIRHMSKIDLRNEMQILRDNLLKANNRIMAQQRQIDQLSYEAVHKFRKS